MGSLPPGYDWTRKHPGRYWLLCSPQAQSTQYRGKRGEHHAEIQLMPLQRLLQGIGTIHFGLEMPLALPPSNILDRSESRFVGDACCMNDPVQRAKALICLIDRRLHLRAIRHIRLHHQHLCSKCLKRLDALDLT